MNCLGTIMNMSLLCLNVGDNNGAFTNKVYIIVAHTNNNLLKFINMDEISPMYTLDWYIARIVSCDDIEDINVNLNKF